MERSDKPRRIGIFGGTFNPIHYGHLASIECIKDEYSLDFVLVIPVKSPVHKDISKLTGAVDRYHMLELALLGQSSIIASPIEIERNTPSFTIDTIDELKRTYPGDKLFLIIGSDSFNELDTWKSYKRILQEVSIIVMMRPGALSLDEQISKSVMDMVIFNGILIDISSSMIRDRIKRGLAVKYMTSDAVIEYIYKKGLYIN